MNVRIFCVRAVECMCAQTRLDLYSHPKEFFGNGVRTYPRENPPLPEKFSSEEDCTHDAASSRTASPTNYQSAITAPYPVQKKLVCKCLNTSKQSNLSVSFLTNSLRQSSLPWTLIGQNEKVFEFFRSTSRLNSFQMNWEPTELIGTAVFAFSHLCGFISNLRSLRLLAKSGAHQNPPFLQGLNKTGS